MPTVTVRWGAYRAGAAGKGVHLSKRMDFDVLPRTGDMITTGWGTAEVTALHGRNGEYTLRIKGLRVEADDEPGMNLWVDARRGEGWLLDSELRVTRDASA